MTDHLTLMQWGLVYAITVAVFLVVDGVWLALVMKPLFTGMLGDMLRSQINIAPAAIFYLAYVVGILFLAVHPALATGDWVASAVRGLALGLLAYGTYDMTNLATLKNYQLSVALIDTAWGGVVTAFTASAGFFAIRWIA
jgi:uncharacterized membrane protein